MQSGFLAKCVGDKEVKDLLEKVHDASCGDASEISLSRRIQRRGYYWPKMKQQADSMQAACEKCQMPIQRQETFMASDTTGDWQQPYCDFLIEGILPTNNREAFNVERIAKRYFVEGENLYRKGFNGEPLRCVDKEEVGRLLQEAHSGECGEHQGRKKLYYQLLSLGYYWPTMKKDTAAFVKCCKTCQLHANLSHKHVVTLQDMKTPWPFHTWGLDLIGPIYPAAEGNIWIITATEYFTK